MPSASRSHALASASPTLLCPPATDLAGPETLHHQQAPGTSAPRNTLEEEALTTTLCSQDTSALLWPLEAAMNCSVNSSRPSQGARIKGPNSILISGVDFLKAP